MNIYIYTWKHKEREFTLQNSDFNIVFLYVGLEIFETCLIFFLETVPVAGDWEQESQKNETEEVNVKDNDDGGGVEDNEEEEEEEEEDEEEEDEGGTTPVVKPKHKPQVEETGEKKDHVNVVFIGHVG